MQTTATNTTNHILENAKIFMERKKLNQSDLAQKIGYSPAVISQIFKGEYVGDTDLVLRKIASVINYSNNAIPVLKTSNFDSTWEICNDAQEEGKMMVNFGPTGCGKTTALEAYYNKTNNCYMVLANLFMKPKDMLLAIGAELGIEMSGNLNDMLDAIVDKLVSLQYPLLIIEDAGKLADHPKCFGVIQLLYDKLKGRCGIVLSGTEYLHKYIMKMAAKDALGFRELKRRITYWNKLKEGVEPKFIVTIAEKLLITDKAAQDYILKNTTNYGDVSELLRTYMRAITRPGSDRFTQSQLLAQCKFNHAN
jgi:DNA transposition AAA+ family ATPase